MPKIFSQRDLAEMRKAANFMWLDEERFLTYGIVENLVADTHADWLEKILDRHNGVQFGGIFK